MLDEDVINAMFLQVIGIRWSVAIKNTLRTLCEKYIPTALKQWHGTVNVSRKLAHEELFLASLANQIETQVEDTGYNVVGSTSSRTKKDLMLRFVT